MDGILFLKFLIFYLDRLLGQKEDFEPTEKYIEN